MFNIFKKKVKQELKENNDIFENNNIIPITWDLLSNEQKIKIANKVLVGEKCTVRYFGEVNTETITECKGIGLFNDKIEYEFETTNFNNMNTTVYFTEERIIKRWIHYCSTGNKNYENIN